MALGWRGQYIRYKEFFLNILAVYKRRPDVKMFLEILLSLGAISFFAVFALRPTFLTIADLLTETKSREETLAKMNEKIKNLSLAHASFDQESVRLSTLDLAIPGDPSIESFIRQIEVVSQINGVGLVGISVNGVVLVGSESSKKEVNQLVSLPEGSKGVEFLITVSGHYASVLSFLSSVENLRRPAKIDTLAIASTKGQEGNKTLVLVIGGRTPYTLK